MGFSYVAIILIFSTLYWTSTSETSYQNRVYYEACVGLDGPATYGSAYSWLSTIYTSIVNGVDKAEIIVLVIVHNMQIGVCGALTSVLRTTDPICFALR